MDGYYRAGQMTDHKVKADEALAVAAKEGQDVDQVLIWRRRPGQYASQTPMADGRDFFVDELLPRYAGQVVEPVSMPAEAPLFLMYTSGTTGRPKGCQHSTGGYLAYVAGTSKYYQDIHPDDVYWCMADIGWITGHSYIVYGPLALGTTTVIYEGVPNYPDGGRAWRIAEKLGVNIFHTSPTAIRMLRKVGPEEPREVPLPLQEHDHRRRADRARGVAVVLLRGRPGPGGHHRHLVADRERRVPGQHPARPGADEAGQLRARRAGHLPGHLRRERRRRRDLRGSGKAGNICIRNPWPGEFARRLGRPGPVLLASYFRKYNTNPDSTDWRDWPYFTNDGAMESGDGYYRILGRVDDVINVAGHRLGTQEIESAALTVPEVAEAGRGPGHRRHPRPGGRGVRLAQAGLRGQRRDGGRRGQQDDRDRDRQDRPAQERLDRRRHAQDPVRQDHAPGHRVRLQLRRRRRRHHPGQPRDRRVDPPPGPGGQGRPRRGTTRAHRNRSRPRSKRSAPRADRFLVWRAAVSPGGPPHPFLLGRTVRGACGPVMLQAGPPR